MKLNDPFNRVNRKQQRTYEALRDNLRQQGICDSIAAKAVADGMSRTAITMSTVLLFATGATVLIFPNASGVILTIATLAAIWIGATYLQARTHLKRFMLEECQSPMPNQNATGKQANHPGEDS